METTFRCGGIDFTMRGRVFVKEYFQFFYLTFNAGSLAGVDTIEYNITPYVGLYLEPGVTHHFDNHSSVENIYKDKPWNFSLNFGFRINLK